MSDEAKTRSAILRLLRNEGPNGVGPQDCGPYADHVQAFFDAWERGGLPDVQSTLRVIVKAETDRHGHSPLLEVLCAPHEHAGLPRLLAPHQLGLLPPSTCLIDPILPINRIVQLFGPPGVGKSFVNLDIALTVAQNTSVLYIPAEAVEDYDERVDAWQHHHNRPAGNVHFWNGPVDLLDMGNVAELTAAAVGLQAQLVVIDPLSSAMPGGDDREARDMKRALEALHQIRAATGACVYVSHHTGWESSRERGHSSLRGASRVVMKLASHDETLVLSVDKINGAKAPPVRRFRLVAAGRSAVPVPVQRVQDTPGRLSEKQILVLDHLMLPTNEEGARFSDLIGATDPPLSKSTLHNVLSRLINQGYVHQDRKKYFVTDEGRMAGRDDEESTGEHSPDGPAGLYWLVDPAVCGMALEDPPLEAVYVEV